MGDRRHLSSQVVIVRGWRHKIHGSGLTSWIESLKLTSGISMPSRRMRTKPGIVLCVKHIPVFHPANPRCMSHRLTPWLSTWWWWRSEPHTNFQGQLNILLVRLHFWSKAVWSSPQRLCLCLLLVPFHGLWNGSWESAQRFRLLLLQNMSVNTCNTRTLFCTNAIYLVWVLLSNTTQTQDTATKTSSCPGYTDLSSQSRRPAFKCREVTSK
jgi:hypothetical protein